MSRWERLARAANVRHRARGWRSDRARSWQELDGNYWTGKLINVHWPH